MRYEVYRHKNTSPEKLKEDLDFYGQVESEDKWLANGAQSNLNSDTYTIGPFHPGVEKGVTYLVKLVKNLLHEHVDEEKKRGNEWWPARRSNPKGIGETVDEDELFCKRVCSSAKANGTEATVGESALAW